MRKCKIEGPDIKGISGILPRE